MTFEELLAGWLPRQRWFAGKGRDIRDIAVVADTELVAGDPALRHLILAVYQGDAVERYQVLLGVRAVLPDRLEHVSIGPIDFPAGAQGDQGAGDPRCGIAYDAAHDAELTRMLLESIAADATIDPLLFRHMPDADVDIGLESLVIVGEQSNTSLVFGEDAILKLFRKLSPGPNPDLEVVSALARVNSSHIAEPFGWIETRLDGVPTTLAILSRYLRTATDGWSLAATSVRDLYATEGLRADEAGGDFAGEARRLGGATAEIHRDLADAFGVAEMTPDTAADLAENMYRRFDLARGAVPALGAYADALGAVFGDLAKLQEPVRIQRIHGDYHLGQVVRTDTRWVVLDFEGEPAKPLAERRALASPLRDVAGMLRSFDYAANHQLIGHPHEDRLAPAARDWVQRNRDAFCDGYAEASGTDPRNHPVLLRALEFDKAIYEVLYEARNRPSWVRIPLESISAAL